MKNVQGVVLYTDGGARGNPGPAGIGVVLADQNGTILKTYSESIGKKTNNEAEYEAVIFGLKKAKLLLGNARAKETPVEIRTDSELIARQLKGEYKIKQEHLFPLIVAAWNLKQDFKTVVVTEIPRGKNTHADRLANEAMDRT